MNIARINASHSTIEGHRQTVHRIKEINEEFAALPEPHPCIALLLDTKGAEVRTGDVTEPIPIAKGEEVIFSPQPLKDSTQKTIIVKHDAFSKDVQKAECILLDNGELVFDLVRLLDDGAVLARARQHGSIGSRRHVNLPGATLTMPSFTEKDWDDIAFGVEEKFDYVALSFVRKASDIREVREFLTKKKSQMLIIAKIETREAVEDIEAIIAESDGVMVARGDLGAEVPYERVPVIQDQIVSRCKKAGKPVIVATQMLESMIHQPMPTRAEVTDIAHAATTATDCTMLSGETANGEYPMESLEAMVRVLQETETHVGQTTPMEDFPTESEREARAKSAVSLAIETKVFALIVMTRTGRTARDISKFRPHIPILAFTHDPVVQRQLQLSFGVKSFLIPFDEKDPEQTVESALLVAEKAGLLQKDKRVVLVSDTKAHELTVNTIQIRSTP